ncbi:MAG: putative Fe-S cluster assembly protein SufT [Acidobacteriota bacterium]|nr:putative Fe-S cluster assembly protein SufT [Acidobacteriota bacterium]MDE3169839.1 putative Fe-S cluster assembly protein SufT [Acidobacteriota bacterium]
MLNAPIKLSRECEAIEIPSGVRTMLPTGTEVRIMQFIGSSYTIVGDYGMFRIDVKDADAIGLTPSDIPSGDQPRQEFSDKLVWDELKTVYDPEIPVNIADLGLIYECDIKPLDGGDHRIDIKMSMTAPGCGMGNVLKSDVESKLSALPTVKEVNVEIVFDPPWGPARMSEAARLQLGFDL